MNNKACRFAMQCVDPLPLPQPTHGKDDNCMCITNPPVHLICNVTNFRRKNVLTFKPQQGTEGVC